MKRLKKAVGIKFDVPVEISKRDDSDSSLESTGGMASGFRMPCFQGFDPNVKIPVKDKTQLSLSLQKSSVVDFSKYSKIDVECNRPDEKIRSLLPKTLANWD